MEKYMREFINMMVFSHVYFPSVIIELLIISADDVQTVPRHSRKKAKE
jgi:hypothetical protein